MSSLAKDTPDVHSFAMGFNNDARRRWLGILFLGIAAGLLIWGQTVFEPYLRGLAFMAYYGICFLFTMLAIFTALLDLWILRTRTRLARRDLVKRAFDQLQRAATANLIAKDSPGRFEEN